ncbi:DUF488 domain-containing protein [Nitrococcus mobilis]|uniref:HhH-GPD domain-containing protein n=1 Tax=Nitrococcus mobilis Nb-231 TaxID=314278 RepID=A4BLC4_9GAMM|nr:DUF488 domain-containing protein [Nitrococcus mobilis]EAR23112.1 hypothetical protein NB231_14868 [Nitrococcus mobilis Nb-231]
MNPTQDWQGARLYTIGHTTRTLDELLALLRAFGIDVLADIRTIPRSRHNPQFNGDTLPSALRPRGIHYAHLPQLGGLRRTHKDSPNTAWRNKSFRGFADYMLTADFVTGLAELHALLAQGTVALMCAEAVPWRCHRSLVADALTARGAQIEHIIGGSRSTPHRLTSFAKVRGARVTYPGKNTAAEQRAQTEDPLHPTALALRGMRPPRFAEWFEAFAKVIPFQQVSLDARVVTVGRLVERFAAQRGRLYFCVLGSSLLTKGLNHTAPEC